MPAFGISSLRMIVFPILGVIDFFFLIGAYSILRILKIEVNWVTRTIGTLIMVASVIFCLFLLIPNHFARIHIFGNLLGVIAFLIAVYSASQWTMRHWYVRIKKHTTALLAKGSRDILLFLRKHHIFFGWIVTLATLAHMVYYLPAIFQFQQYKIVTGFIALGALTLLVLLGMWIWLQTAIRKQRMPKVVQTIHSALTIIFLVVLVLHM